MNFTVNNPLPTITSLSPASATVGAGAQTLAINGTNYLSSSVVTYNGVTHAAAYVNSGQLTIQLNASGAYPEGTLHRAVADRLSQYAEKLRALGSEDRKPEPIAC